MQLWPAIDLLEGRCVRLQRGDFAMASDFGDPLDAADAIASSGAGRVHVVDLDAARSGASANLAVVEEIAARGDLVVQAGGGIRDRAAAERLLSLGAARVVIGTAAVETPDLVRELAEAWPDRVLVGLDHRRGTLSVRGWQEASKRSVDGVLADLDGLALAGVVVTEIERDGTLCGPDLKGLRRVLGLTGQRVIASGGVAGPADLEELARLEEQGRRLDGVVVGRAIYSGRLTLPDALAAVAPTAGPER